MPSGGMHEAGISAPGDGALTLGDPAAAEPASEFAEAAIEQCRLLLAIEVDRVEWPGGRDRQSLRARLPGQAVIVTRRPSERRAELEAHVLRVLERRGAPVPALLAASGSWLIQEDVGSFRLSAALNAGDPGLGEEALEAGLSALRLLQEAGRDAGLERRVAIIGAGRDWLERLIDQPRRLGQRLGLSAPQLDSGRLLELLRPVAPSFVKWDARPANAALDLYGHIGWFDWQYSGCRDPLDDMAWLLTDEFVPLWPQIEGRLIERHLVAFAGRRAASDALIYLRTFGTLHMLLRLGLIIDSKGEGPWWRWSTCLTEDKVGVTRQAVERLCKRAAAWSTEAPALSALASWLELLPERIGAEA